MLLDQALGDRVLGFLGGSGTLLVFPVLWVPAVQAGGRCPGCWEGPLEIQASRPSPQELDTPPRPPSAKAGLSGPKWWMAAASDARVRQMEVAYECPCRGGRGSPLRRRPQRGEISSAFVLARVQPISVAKSHSPTRGFASRGDIPPDVAGGLLRSHLTLTHKRSLAGREASRQPHPRRSSQRSQT